MVNKDGKLKKDNNCTNAFIDQNSSFAIAVEQSTYKLPYFFMYAACFFFSLKIYLKMGCVSYMNIWDLNGH